MRGRVSSQKLRKLAFDRDGGICAACRADCEKAKRVYWAILDYDAQCWYAETVLASDGQTFWEADHIQERAANGSDSIRNIQTLCVACHKTKTADFMRQGRPMPPIFPCATLACKDWEHAETILELVEKRYDAVYYVGDGTRFVVNIGPGLKSDYMTRSYAVVRNHLPAMREMVSHYYQTSSIQVDGTH